MISLFIDTSGIDVSIGLIKDNKILSLIEESIPGKHSVYTTSYIDKVLKDSCFLPSDVDEIYVVTGPGSFTGVRIGTTIAKVYAYLTNAKAASVSSLKMLKLSSTIENDYYLSLIDAKHDNYYTGLYSKDNKTIIEGFMNINEINELINKYNPIILSPDEIEINNKKIEKTNLNIIKIIEYYKNEESINPHLLNPTYLKEPQVMEQK